MGLIYGIVMGMVFGLALMLGWRQMMRYRSSKRISKAVDIKSISSLSRDDLKKIHGENYPEWISFPVFEQVKWLNKQLSKLWSYVADAAEAIIKESVETLLEDYRPPGITSLKFSKLSLGTVAPKIEGIRVQSLKEGQITMDIELRWGGDPSIILAVEAALVASIPIQLNDLKVFTIVRAIFQLTDEIPCISAVVVALLAEPKPRIDYTLKAVGGSLTAIPGISDMIDVKTKVIKDNLNPVWNQTFELIAEDKETQSLIFEVYDEDIGQDKRLGIAELPLIELEPEAAKESELRLLPSLDMLKIKDKKDRGTVTIQVLYHEFNKEEQLAALEEEQRIIEERKKLKEAGVIGGGVVVGTGIGAGVGLVGSGLGAVGSGLGKAGKLMGRTITGQSTASKSNGSSAPVNSAQEISGAKPL